MDVIARGTKKQIAHLLQLIVVRKKSWAYLYISDAFQEEASELCSWMSCDIYQRFKDHSCSKQNQKFGFRHLIEQQVTRSKTDKEKCMDLTNKLLPPKHNKETALHNSPLQKLSSCSHEKKKKKKKKKNKVPPKIN